VLTYNIHHGAGTDGKYDLSRVAQVIKDSGADLVALQEVDRNTNRTKTDQPAELARLTGFHACFGRAMDYQGGQYGDMILSRWPVQSFDVHALPYKAGHDREPRCIVIARVGAPGGLIVFASTHLDHTGGPENDRLAQANEIVRTLKAEKLPTILAGDFNATPTSKPIAAIESVWMNITGDEPTCPSIRPREKIDYVFVNSRVRGIEQEVIDDRVTSDHRPVRVKVEVYK
jgi:endonuclease/exonuclease/phosphatase family metal-dependent hydrolase